MSVQLLLVIRQNDAIHNIGNELKHNDRYQNAYDNPPLGAFLLLKLDVTMIGSTAPSSARVLLPQLGTLARKSFECFVCLLLLGYHLFLHGLHFYFEVEDHESLCIDLFRCVWVRSCSA